MIKKIFKQLFKTGVKATKSSQRSMDFIDEVLEKEYLTGALDNLKTSSGKMVEKAGMIYQQAINKVDDKVNIDKLKDMGDQVVKKGKEITEDISESMQESSSTLKSVIKEGEQIVKDIIGEEE